MKIEIKSRWTGAVLFTAEVGSFRLAVELAVSRDAYLRGAYLRGADLRGAYLGGAYLRDAYLGGADLRGAYLSGAYLRDAYLRGAYLRGAYLRDADLRDADLRGAYLRDADLGGAKNVPDLSQPVDHAAIAEAYRVRHPEVPVVEHLDAKILAAIEADGKLDMTDWHHCKMTHCRGGWAIHLAGEGGYALEAKYDSERAAVMIYRASTGRVPDFFATATKALEDIEKCAEGL